MRAPNRPNQIQPAEFNNWEIITQANVAEILDNVEKGEREPLNHIMLPYNDYLTLGGWMQDILRYVRQAEKYMDEVDEMEKRSNEPSTPPVSPD